jgi:tetratricopeptide (TPR) repeat protein
MDTLMNAGCVAPRKVAIVASCFCLALQMGLAQKNSANAPGGTRAVLVEKALAMESRGRPDMAVQIWQQILLADPANTEALAGLAKDYKLIGSIDNANEALERLRKINPNDPNIAKIEAQTSSRNQSDQLRHASELARRGNADDAMRIYRDLYGDHPPEGDIALAYYQTLYGTANGKQQAISGMRGLAERNPGDQRIAVELGVLLTYDAKTRAEGIRILKAHPQDANVQAGLRQALIWDAANPATTADMRQYLKGHPQDMELSSQVKENEQKLSQMNTGIARTQEERAAFAALNAHRADEAEKRFLAILAREPENGRVAAGMGFLRMQQENFGGAISYLTQAEQNGYKAKAVEDGLATSQFWFTMAEAGHAVDDNQLPVATAKYQAALAMRPRSPEALNGLASLLIKEQQFAAAAGVYEQLVKVQPASAQAWRGLFLAYARDNKNKKALDLSARAPRLVQSALAKDPEYLRTLAAIYHDQNRDADARRVLAQALSLPFPNNGTTLKADTKLQYAGILMEAKRFDQAAALYAQILSDDPSNLSAWTGAISAHHELGQDSQAVGEIERMPPARYETALADPAFLSMLGAIYQRANQLEVAQGFLERAARLQIGAGGQPTVSLQLQLAGIYLARNNTGPAYDLYQKILTSHPDSIAAWKGLISALQSTNRSNEAIQQIALIPPQVRRQLDTDIEFVHSEASLYAAIGDYAHAAEYMSRVQAHYSHLKAQPPANIEVENAWLLFNTVNDRSLYPALMRLGGRTDLTIAQREAVQKIWASWSVRRAAAAMNNGDAQRAVDILDAASQAFPDNLDVRKAVAGGYGLVGRSRLALKLYQTIPMRDASAGDFEGAVGAALAANDKTQAEIWLRQALERYARDPGILSLAARFEQARGDNQRAADYYRAALAAMPPGSPIAKLAHELYYPEQDTRSHRAVTAADLERLLDPNAEPFAKTTKLPPLPAYGPDPYGGSTPVEVNPRQPSPREVPQPAQQDVPDINNPSGAASDLPLPPPLASLLIPRNATPEGNAKTATPTHQTEGSVRTPSRPGTAASHTGGTGSQPSYTGKMNLPPSEQNITSIEPVPNEAAPSSQERFVVSTEQSKATPIDAKAAGGLRIASQPMDSMAAEVQARFADQTDGQLTQGSALQIHTIANAPTSSSGRLNANAAGSGKDAAQYTDAQYTPSAQEAAAGAYSASKQQQAPPPTQQAAQQPAPAKPTAAKRKPAHKKTAAHKETQPAATPTLENAPAAQPDQEQVQFAPAPPAEPAPPSTTTPVPESTGAGMSDEELEQRNLPPLRGPWVRVQRAARPLDPREEAEMALRSIESGYSPWLGGSGIVNYRSGALGYDHLAALEAPFEVSMPLGYNARLTIVAKPVFLDSGQADGTSTITVQEFLAGKSTLLPIPQPIGTLVDAANNPPAQQNAFGIGGEVQLAFPHLAFAGGYTPAGFLVATFTGRAQWKPGDGPFMFNFSRDSVKDTQLSYSGLRDPAGTSLGNQGQIWGGVIANQGNVQYTHGDAESGFYFGVGGQYLSGYHVETNIRIDGSGGAYWRLKTVPEFGNLSIGANFFGMHYSHNENAFTLGMGGYFSPQAYFLANVPISWAGHYQTRWHYNVVGSLGVQGFQENLTPLFPLAAQSSFEIGLNNPMLPAKTSVGPNYDLHGQMSYQIGPHWFAGGYFAANNSRDYNAVSAGFSIHYIFRSQPSTATGPTGLFPVEGVRPFRVP